MLRPYSYDFNSIEHGWALIKKRLRRHVLGGFRGQGGFRDGYTSTSKRTVTTESWSFVHQPSLWPQGTPRILPFLL